MFPNENACDTWTLDSGAAYYMTYHREWFSSYTKLDMPLTVHLLTVQYQSYSNNRGYRGNIECEVFIAGAWVPRRIEDALFVPEFRRNLFSQSSVLDKGMLFNSSKSECEFTKDGEQMVCGVRDGRLLSGCSCGSSSQVMPVRVSQISLSHSRYKCGTKDLDIKTNVTC